MASQANSIKQKKKTEKKPVSLPAEGSVPKLLERICAFIFESEFEWRIDIK